MHLLITDNVLSNTGDAAILLGTMSAMQQAGFPEPFAVHCEYDDSHAKLYPHLPVRMSLMEATRRDPPRFFWRYRIPSRARFHGVVSATERDALRDYRSADVIVSVGGAFLTDTYNIRPRLAGFDVARVFGRPLAILGQTIGPFRSESIAEEVGKRLRQMSLIALRDQRSFELARELVRDPSRLLRCADFAFSLHPVNGHAHRDAIADVGQQATIFIAPRRWTYPGDPDPESRHAQYVSKMASVVSGLVSRLGCRVLFMSTCQGIAGYSFHDEQVAAEIVDSLEFDVAENVELDHEPQTVHRFMTRVSGADVLIGTRMHACILAMIQGVPAINIEYEFKSSELYRELGISNLCHSIDRFVPEDVVNDVESILARPREVRDQVASRIGSFRRLNLEAVIRLREMLEGAVR